MAVPILPTFPVDVMVSLAYVLCRFLGWLLRLLAVTCALLSFRSRPSPPQSPDCHLLRLPAELLLFIADDLPPTSRVLLAHTCRDLYDTMYGEARLQRALAAIAQLPRAHRLAFLATVVRDDRDRWLCDACGALHSVLLRDTATCGMDGQELPMPLRFYGGRHRHHLWKARPTNRRDWSPWPHVVRHRHVQLVLKYTRMQQQQQANTGLALTFYHRHYLQRLLTPFAHRVTFGFVDQFRQPVRFPCSFFPKVVALTAANTSTGNEAAVNEATTNSNGNGNGNGNGSTRLHYFILCVYETTVPGRFYSNPDPATRTTYQQPICPHLSLDYEDICAGGAPKVAGRNVALAEPPRRMNTKANFWPKTQWRTVDVDAVYTESTKNTRGRKIKKIKKTTQECTTSCYRCATDVVLRDGRTFVYKDLGPELSAFDWAWQSHLRSSSPLSLHVDQHLLLKDNSIEMRPSIWHKPGGIESLYKGEEKSLPKE